MLLCKHINNYLYEQQKTCSSENEILCIDGVGSKEHVPSMDSSLHPGCIRVAAKAGLLSQAH
jgi:hypothetical protein